MAMFSDLGCHLISAVKSEDLDELRSLIQQYRNNPVTAAYAKEDLGHALCIAANCGSLVMVKELLKYKADVVYADDAGRRPIHFACLSNSVDVLRQIIRGGSPVSVRDHMGASALHYAVENQNREMVSFLVREGAAVTKIKTYNNDETALHLAAKLGNEEIVSTILRRSVDANMMTLDKHTPLMYAVKNHHVGVVRALCEARVNLELRNEKGDAALHLSVESFTPIVRILLEHGANPSCTNFSNQTPLHRVAFRQPATDSSILMTSLLLKSNTNIHATDKNGYTPLHSASLSGNVAVATMLLDHGAAVNVVEKLSGNSPLITAVSNNRFDMVELLVERGADVNLCNDGLMSPLHTVQGSRNHQKYQYTDFLLRQGAKVNKISQRGYAPLDRCVFHSMIGTFSTDTLMRLVQAGAHLRPIPGPKSNMQHNSPLCWLTWHGNLPVARFLVDSGWDLKRENWIRLPGKNKEAAEFLAYVWSLVKQPRSLMMLCRKTIREYANSVTMDTDIVPVIDSLPMPSYLKRYLNLEMEVETCKEMLEGSL